MTDTYRNGMSRANHIYRMLREGKTYEDDEEVGCMFTESAGILFVRAVNHYLRCRLAPGHPGEPDAYADPRAAERHRRRKEAAARADQVGRSIACQSPDPRRHHTCGGPRGLMNNGWGCLCECHDGQPSAVDTEAEEATA